MQVPFDDLSEVVKVPIQDAHHRRVRPFLRAVDGGGTVGPHSGLSTSHATAISTLSTPHDCEYADRCGRVGSTPRRRGRVPGARRQAGGSLRLHANPPRHRWWHFRRMPTDPTGARRRLRRGSTRRFLGSSVREGRASRGMRTRPEADAISTTAVAPSPRIPNRAVTEAPRGPVTLASRNEPPVASTRASTVPSPPSAMGIGSIEAVGHALAIRARSLERP